MTFKEKTPHELELQELREVVANRAAAIEAFAILLGHALSSNEDIGAASYGIETLLDTQVRLLISETGSYFHNRPEGWKP